IRLSIGEIWSQISGEKRPSGGRTVGQALLFLLGVIGLLFLIIEALALIAGLALAKSITGSIHELFIGTGRVRQGDFTHKIPVKSDDQLGELTDSFNTMTASIEDLLRQAAEKKRLEEELRIAREIQMSLLPQGPLLMTGLTVTALCVHARAGHTPLMYLPGPGCSDPRRIQVLAPDGLVLGLKLDSGEMFDRLLEESTIKLNPGDLFVFYTDGISEAMNEGDDCFGETRL